MSAKIIISREKGWFSGNGGILRVFFDEKEVDEMAIKSTFIVEEGVYAVQVKMPRDFIKTQVLIVKALEGKEVHLMVRNGIKYYSILYIFMLLSISGTLFFILSEIAVPKWYSILQFCCVIGFILYVLGMYIFKKGMIRILEETRPVSKMNDPAY
jgi:hypothetical protein